MSSPRRRRWFATMSLLVGALALAGCGKEPANVVHVSGTVTFDGKPVPLGMIVFEPDPSKSNSGRQGHADIKDGKFDTPPGNPRWPRAAGEAIIGALTRSRPPRSRTAYPDSWAIATTL